MIAYSHIRYAMYFLSIAYSISVNWLILNLGLSVASRNFGTVLSKRLYIQILAAVLLLTVLSFLLFLPFQLFNSFWLEHMFHLSSESFSSWFLDGLKGLALRMVGGLFIALFFLFVKKFPKRWPILIASLNAFLIVAVMYIEPNIIEPIFNKFEPMPAGSLRTQIEVLLKRADLKDAPIFLVNKSKQTNKLNAYVTGIGNSARVVIWDNTVASMPEPQVLAVIGHELGHYKLNHLYIGLALALAANFAIVPFANPLANLTLRLAPKKWKLKDMSDPAVLPLINIILVLVSFFSAPFVNAVSRRMEHQADEYSLAVYGNRNALAEAFVTLSEHNLSEPNPPKLIEFWLFSHPSLESRIKFALQGTPHFPKQLVLPAESSPQ